MRIKIHPHIIKMAITSEYAKNHEHMHQWIDKDMNTMIEYYKHVYNMPQRIEMFRARYDREDFQNRVMELDQQRKDKHDAAISALIDLNDCCRECKINSCVDVGDKIYDVTSEDIRNCERSIIADGIFDFCGKWIQATNNSYSPQARKTQINDKIVKAQSLAEEKGLVTNTEENEQVLE